MTPRQTALLNYHRDVASIGTSAKTPVFVILDLEDSVGFKIASMFQPNYAKRWIEEFRLEFPSASQCRAIVFREMVESGRESGGTERLVIPWAHMLTDQVAERVEAFDRGIWKN
jgi:hypothetical protein